MRKTSVKARMLAEELSGPVPTTLASNNAVGGSLLGVTSMKTDKHFGKFWRHRGEKIDFSKSTTESKSNTTNFNLRLVERTGNVVTFDRANFEQGTHERPQKADKMKVRLKFHEPHTDDSFLIGRNLYKAAEDISDEWRSAQQPNIPQSVTSTARVYITVDHLPSVMLIIGALTIVAFVIGRAIKSHVSIFRPLKKNNEKAISENIALVERDKNGHSVIRIGRILYYPDSILGRGSNGAVVFRGTYNDRLVAVKRMLKRFSHVADREVAILSRIDGHPNVIRYFTKEDDGEYSYLALQLCSTSVEDFTLQVNSVTSDVKEAEGPRGGIADSTRAALLQVARGLSHMHAQRIVHRAIKPRNILCAASDEKAYESTDGPKSIDDLGMFVLKISEMGSSLHLNEGVGLDGASGVHVTECPVDSEFQHHNEEDTRDWQAPELVCDIAPSSEPSILQSADIFSLGCVFYYILAKGTHPFGQPHERGANMRSNTFSLRLIQHLPDVADLISRMIDSNRLNRPSIAQVCDHPFFWSSQKRLSFLCELSDMLEHESSESLLISRIESNAKRVTGDRWDSMLDRDLFEDFEKYRKYDTKSVRDLLRMIRNKRHHYNELPARLRAIVGDLPCGYLGYFESRFPSLFMECAFFACNLLPDNRETTEKFLQSKDLFVSTPCIAYNSIAIDSPDMSTNMVQNIRQSRHWWDNDTQWTDAHSIRGHPKSHVARSSGDVKYRSRLCSHWEVTLGDNCSVRKKGKCDFAHGPLELRVKESRRERWGTYTGPVTSDASLRLTGGEDTLGAARAIDRRGLP